MDEAERVKYLKLLALVLRIKDLIEKTLGKSLNDPNEDVQIVVREVDNESD